LIFAFPKKHLTSFTGVVVQLENAAYDAFIPRLRDALAKHSTTLTAIDLSGSPRITHEELLDILTPLSNLKSIKFRSCEYVKIDAVKKIAEMFPFLDVLHMNDSGSNFFHVYSMSGDVMV
jgi:hypothetical protein